MNKCILVYQGLSVSVRHKGASRNYYFNQRSPGLEANCALYDISDNLPLLRSAADVCCPGVPKSLHISNVQA